MRRTMPFEQAYLDARKHITPRRVAGRWTARTRVDGTSITRHGTSAERARRAAALAVAVLKFKH